MGIGSIVDDDDRRGSGVQFYQSCFGNFLSLNLLGLSSTRDVKRANVNNAGQVKSILLRQRQLEMAEHQGDDHGDDAIARRFKALFNKDPVCQEGTPSHENPKDQGEYEFDDDEAYPPVKAFR
jgi:hypothetical protein